MLLEQVVLNLVHNAVEAMEDIPADQRSLEISTSVMRGDVIIEVCDSGPGISRGIQEKIFDPFYTTKSKGMGMGLAITRSIINAHKGRLEVKDNQHQAGATFRVTLPVSD